jgi:hypothetical protein
MAPFNNSVGLHVGLLLKSCGNFGAQTKLIKVGIFFAKAVGVNDARLTIIVYVSVKRRQKTATLGAVFGVLSTAPQHVGLAAFKLFLGSCFDGLAPYSLCS